MSNNCADAVDWLLTHLRIRFVLDFEESTASLEGNMSSILRGPELFKATMSSIKVELNS